jgi:hypothetical protein
MTHCYVYETDMGRAGFPGAKIEGCIVFGVSAWKVNLDEKTI